LPSQYPNWTGESGGQLLEHDDVPLQFAPNLERLFAHCMEPHAVMEPLAALVSVPKAEPQTPLALFTGPVLGGLKQPTAKAQAMGDLAQIDPLQFGAVSLWNAGRDLVQVDVAITTGLSFPGYQEEGPLGIKKRRFEVCGGKALAHVGLKVFP